MLKTKNIQRSINTSVWIFYFLIVFEILYMISPFALYYYSLYKAPLQFLQSNSYTSFLTINILPHFTYHTSIMISILNFISWPLVILGLLLFLVGFLQIYWAKFTRKGIVSGGLYKFVRHPQYVTLAILGLGTTIYWSRFLVYFMYATMLFLYYFLAKQEEKICLEKYGESYRKYCKQTGMFFPKAIENRLPRIHSFLPHDGYKRLTVVALLYVVYITTIIGIGFMVRNYEITKILAQYYDDKVVISVAPLDKEQIQKALDITLKNEKMNVDLSRLSVKKYLFYVVPSDWSIPELGIISRNENMDYLTNTASHGNSDNFNKESLIVLITEPVLFSSDVKGKDILKNSLSFKPYFEVMVDLSAEKITSINERKDKGRWEGIPVPIY